ncbi:antibiotic biosynthesis monooxygenase family protein [Sungkyunkwania multivorans]|uniref:Antibiotic biosynthesis monooxygenase family protein n=1 Tax=Sungkyunkwania multivorans TaxID=1173618 RepID=A0ABW3D2G5_9FLAO
MKTDFKPYYAVIFTNKRTLADDEGYGKMAVRMEALAKEQPGYLGMDHARTELGITISYWESLEAIKHWKNNLDHQNAQEKGRQIWYEWYHTRICKVEREYEFNG